MSTNFGSPTAGRWLTPVSPEAATGFLGAQKATTAVTRNGSGSSGARKGSVAVSADASLRTTTMRDVTTR